MNKKTRMTMKQWILCLMVTTDAAPAPRPGAPDFAAWAAEDAPLAKERITFNWHNFLSGCTAWNFDDWTLWIDQSRNMRYNTVMVHAYGNNPMFTFAHNGAEKPVGFIASTLRGRDWGTAHVNDVQRLAGGAVFPGTVFGSDAALATNARRVEEKQALMRRVIDHARDTGMLVTMNLKWVQYIESLRQSLGLAPVRMSFGPTSHEEKAQGAGTLTFHVGPDGSPWRVCGAKETGAAVISATVLEPIAASVISN